MKNILGRKVGMTQIFGEDGELIPVSVVSAGPIIVVQKKTLEKDGYNAIQVGFCDMKDKKANKPMKGHFAKAEAGLKEVLQEIKVEDPEAFQIGQEIKVDIFEAGDKIDIIGTSKGKGTQGVVKRHGFATGHQTHGSRFHRSPGGMGAASSPGKVWKGHKMSGRMGNERVTIQNLEIVRVDLENNLLLIKGAIPGPKKGFVTIQRTTRRIK